MKNSFFLNSTLAILLLTFSCAKQKNANEVLFNGDNLEKWASGKNEGFKIIDGELFTGTFGKGYNLFTKKEYANFILKLEYQLSKVGNSGVLIRCNTEDPWKTGVEIQILAPWTPERDNLHCTGSIYDHVAVSNRPCETTGIWHKMEIRCDRKLISIFVDESLTTQANIDTVNTMKKKLKKGVIGLQVNHAEVEGQFAKFRNIYIKDLDKNPKYVSKGFYEKKPEWRTLAHKKALLLGHEMINSLSVMISGEDPIAKNGAKQVLFDLVSQATDPKADRNDKKKIKKELKRNIRKTSSQYTKDYLNELLRLIRYSQ